MKENIGLQISELLHDQMKLFFRMTSIRLGFEGGGKSA